MFSACEELLLHPLCPLSPAQDIGTAFYILEAGETKIVKDGEEVARLKSGAHFGEQALAVLRLAFCCCCVVFRPIEMIF